MDIPPGLVSLSHYRASLGHKVLLEKFKSLKFKLWFIYFHFQYFKLIFFIENFKSQKSKVWHINNKKIETLHSFSFALGKLQIYFESFQN